MCGAVSIALLLCAAYATWRWLNPSRWTVVIDADGVHDHASGKTMRWDEVYHVAYDERGGGITLAERPPAKARRPAMPGLTDARGHGIGINTENSDCDPIAILAAIKHFACAAGSGVEVPELVTRTRRRGAA
jgi:hypothetical protein